MTSSGRLFIFKKLGANRASSLEVNGSTVSQVPGPLSLRISSRNRSHPEGNPILEALEGPCN